MLVFTPLIASEHRHSPQTHCFKVKLSSFHLENCKFPLAKLSKFPSVKLSKIPLVEKLQYHCFNLEKKKNHPQ